MAVKFRRIEDRRESVVQMRQRQENRKERRHLLPKVAVVVVAALIGAAAIVYLRPPRVVAPFMVHVDVLEVASPIDGTVAWLPSKDVGRLAAGDVIARVTAGPQSGGSVPARLTDLKLRAADAEADATMRGAELAELQGHLDEQKFQLEADVAQVKERVVQAELGLADAAAQADARREDAETAARLLSLSAITEHDHATASRSLRTAEVATETAESRLRNLQTELKAAEAAMGQFELVARTALNAAAVKAVAAEERHGALTEAQAPLADGLSDDGREYVVRCPAGGRLLELDTAVGDSVERGAPLVSIYEERTMVARVYVPVRYRGSVKMGAEARLYAKGRSGEAAGKVVYIHDRVVQMPGSLAQRVGYKEPNVVWVDIELTAGDSFVPGQAGKAVIRK